MVDVEMKFDLICHNDFYDENEQCLGIVMEYADKGDLYQKILEFKKAGVYFEESDIFRIFCFFDKGKLIILANGFQKKTQKTPKKEIEKALKIKQEYENENK